MLVCPSSMLGQSGHALIHHFDRRELGGDLASWNIVAQSNDAVAAANGEGMLVFDGGQWQLLSLPNQAAARSIAFAQDGQWICGGQGFVGKASNIGRGTCTFEDWTPQIVAQAGGFEDVWRLYPVRSKTGDSLQFVASSTFVGLLDSNGAFEALEIGPIENGFRWGRDGVGWQVQDTIWHWENGNVERYTMPSGLRIEAVIDHQDGRLQAFSHARGAFTWQADQATWKPDATALSRWLRTYRTNCMLPDDDGWWFGSSSGGLCKSQDGRSPEVCYDESNGLVNNAILSTSLDDRGNLWVSTEGGLDLIRLAWPVVRAEPQAIAAQPGYASLHDEERGEIYWATSRGLFIENTSTRNVVQAPEIPGPVWSIERRAGQFWVSFIDGCGIWDPEKASFQPVIENMGVWGIWEATDGALFAGTFEGIRQLIPPVGFLEGLPWTALPPMDGFSESSRFVGFEHPDTLWVTHPFKGAFRLALKRQENQVEVVGAYGPDQGFPEPMDVYLGEVDNELLFATSSGIYQWNADSNRMAPASGNWGDWLNPSGAYRLVASDPGGALWASEGAVLIRFNAERQSLHAGVQVTRAPLTDALPIAGFERLEFLADGRVCVPTESGFVYVNPETMLRKEDVPVVDIGHVTHLNHPEGSRELPADSDIVLPAGPHALQIELVSTDSRWTGRLKYQWRIPSVSEDWSEPQYGRSISLNGLQPGRHNVEFRAIIHPSLAGPAERISIVIAQPWQQQWSVQLAFFLLTIGLFVLWWKRNKARLQKEHQATTNKQQAEIQKVESRLAEERLQFAQSQVQTKDAELASVTMNLVQKAQLVQTVHSSLRKLKDDLSPEQQKQVDQLLKLIQEGGKLDDAWEQFTQQFDQVHIDFHQRLMELFPYLTKNDIKLCSYLRMGLSTKEIASLMFVTVRAVEVSRSRLRKRLDLPPETKLTTFIQNL